MNAKKPGDVWAPGPEDLAAWDLCLRGKQALLVSDMHLGHVNGASFAQRIAGLCRCEVFKNQKAVALVVCQLFSREFSHRRKRQRRTQDRQHEEVCFYLQA